MTVLRSQPGLYGVTKLEWSSWPRRNWLSWLCAAVFITLALVAVLLTANTGAATRGAQVALRYTGVAVLVALVSLRLVLEGTVSKVREGEAPRWDRQLADPWWTSIHTLTGLTLGIWLTPFVLVAVLTVLWEVLEICVPGFGDEEVNGNRAIDILVAWVGSIVGSLLVSAL